MSPNPHTRRTAPLPLAGAAYTVVMVAAAAAFPAPPAGDTSVGSAPAWLLVHRDAVIAQGFVRALAAVCFTVLVVAVARSCSRVLPDSSGLPGLALSGGVLYSALLLSSQAAAFTTAKVTAQGGGPALVRAFGQLQVALLDFSSLPAGVLFVAVGVAALRGGVLPRWLAAASLAGGPVALLDAASYDGGPVAWFGLLGLAYFLLWALVVGIHLQRAALPVRVGRPLVTAGGA